MMYNENYDNNSDPLSQSTLNYDDKVNPFKTISDGMLADRFSYPSLSPNDIIKYTDKTINGTITYTYNNSNLPISTLEETDSGGNWSQKFYNK